MPGGAKPAPPVLAKRRGHASRVGFLAYLRDGDVILCDIGSVTFSEKTGRFGTIWKTVLPADGRPEREFSIRNQTRVSLRALIELEIEAGVIFSPQPSMDQRRLLGE